MKPRDLIELVRPDHVSSLNVWPPSFKIRDGQRVQFVCSCGYEASLMENIPFAVAYPEMSGGLREAWLRYKMTEHLLDQEIHPTDVTQLLRELAHEG